MVYFEQDCASLLELFKFLPDALPLVSPSGRILPPQIDLEFAQDEGAYPAFNKTMHATFGDKSKGLAIEEHGEGLLKTVSTIRWCLKQLERMDMDFGDRNELAEYFQLVPEHWGKCEPVSLGCAESTIL